MRYPCVSVFFHGFLLHFSTLHDSQKLISVFELDTQLDLSWVTELVEGQITIRTIKAVDLGGNGFVLIFRSTNPLLSGAGPDRCGPKAQCPP